eukprot:TRINITY_DN757_c0_g1_i4.p1 TRINITY_DN757_c0_g1~~TRINITY_DN757_c0_g1_i4.p1  ORF type:complete len:359 (+),score=117.79 TRINITY_DN757_c0_g1_i4:271-1347(+)
MFGRGGGAIRTADRAEFEEPPAKKRLLSAVVKVEDVEPTEHPEKKDDKTESEKGSDEVHDEKPHANGKDSGFQATKVVFGRGRGGRMEQERFESTPRILPKDEDPRLVKRNKRMLGQLLGTLEKFREQDKQLSSSEAFVRRSDSLKRAEQRAREESERLRQQEREQLAEKRRRDLTLRARIVAKAEEKKLELLFIHWMDHHKKLNKFLRTKTEPAIFYSPVKPLESCSKLLDEQQKELTIWKEKRREELSEYQKQVTNQIVSNAEVELQRWQAAANSRNAKAAANLQESMDNDLEAHKLSHGPKKHIPRSGEDADEDVDDVGDDDMLDDVLDQEENLKGREEDAGTDKGIVGYGSAEE